MQKFLLITDLEGSAGVDRFIQTQEGWPEFKLPAMELLTREVNACIEGIRSVIPDADIDAWDGHGYGGLLEQKLVGARFISLTESPYWQLQGYAAVLFVGQHAMAGTIFAPLCHTYSSKDIAYFKLNNVFIGEFGARALLAGYQGVPTIFLSGDDKAVYEAKMFIPEIETIITKRGTGLESANHLEPDEACRLIKTGAAKAIRRMAEISPFIGIKPPFIFEARFYEPEGADSWNLVAERIDSRTLQIKTSDITKLPL